MKAQTPRFSFFINAEDGVQYEWLRARFSHEAGIDAHVRVLSVSDKDGNTLLILNAPHPVNNYCNGAKALPVDKKDIPDAIMGMNTRALRKRIADLEAITSGDKIYAAADVLSAMKDVDDALSVPKPSSLSTLDDLRAYGQSLAYAILERKDAADGSKKELEKLKTGVDSREAAYSAENKELEAKLREAEKGREKVIEERDSAKRERQVVIDNGQRYVLANAELEKKVKALETEKVAFLDAMRAVKSERDASRTAVKPYERALAQLQGEIAALQKVRDEQTARYDKLEEKLTATEHVFHACEEELQKARGRLHKRYDTPQPAAEKPPAAHESQIEVPSGTLISDPRAEFTAEILTYIALRDYHVHTKALAIEGILFVGKVPSVREMGRGGSTHVYEYGSIDDGTDTTLVVRIAEYLATPERTAGTIIRDVRSFFTAGEQCGYNPDNWKPDDIKSILDITLGTRKSFKTVEMRLKGILKVADDRYKVSEIPPIIQEKNGFDLKRPEPVYKS